MTLEGAVTDAQATVSAAQAWAAEDRGAVCRGSSIGLGTTVGTAVFVVTGVEWLGLQACWAAERFTNGFSGDLPPQEWPMADDEQPEDAAPQGTRIGVGIALGLGIGAALGVALGDIALGVGVGVAIGAAAGAGLEQQARSERKR